MPEHGVFVHKLALTFSTLLSSQVSGAHRAVSSDSAWGNSTYFSDSLQACQIRPAEFFTRFDYPVRTRASLIRGNPT
jgi:hypothetical protein